MFGKEKDKSDVIETLPMVPLRDVVVFPHMMIPFVIGRPSSIKALEYALVKGKRIFLSAQHDATRDNPGPEEIHTLGTICNIVQSLKLPDGNVKVLVEGLDRGRALEFKEEQGFFRVVVKLIPKQVETGGGIEAVMSKVIALFEQYVKLSNNLHYDAMLAAVRVEDPGKLADTISSHLIVPVEEKQNLLEIFSPQESLQRILTILEAEVDKLQVDKRIQGRVKKQMERAQKEYYLNEKMKAIQKELGRKDDRLNEVEIGLSDGPIGFINPDFPRGFVDETVFQLACRELLIRWLELDQQSIAATDLFALDDFDIKAAQKVLIQREVVLLEGLVLGFGRSLGWLLASRGSWRGWAGREIVCGGNDSRIVPTLLGLLLFYSSLGIKFPRGLGGADEGIA